VRHHRPEGLPPEDCGGIWGDGYLLEILVRCSVCGLGGVIQLQIALDGFPQVMVGITPEAAMLAAPVVIPIGGRRRAQVAQRGRKLPG
jgi:hypothetical protein